MCQKLGKSRVRQSFLATGCGSSRGMAACEFDVNSGLSFSIDQGTSSSYSSSDTLKVDGGWKMCWETVFFYASTIHGDESFRSSFLNLFS